MRPFSPWADAGTDSEGSGFIVAGTQGDGGSSADGASGDGGYASAGSATSSGGSGASRLTPSSGSDLSSITHASGLALAAPVPTSPHRIRHFEPHHWPPPPAYRPLPSGPPYLRIRTRLRALRVAPMAPPHIPAPPAAGAADHASETASLGALSTGGRARRRRSVARRDGAEPPPSTTFSIDECLARRAARVRVLKAKKERRRVTALLEALVGHLRLEGEGILAEVSGLQWAPARWLPWIFPSTLSDPTEVAPASALSPESAARLAHMDLPVWRLILERITCVASISPLGIKSLFTASALLRVDAFVELFAHVKKRPSWLVAVVRRLRILRAGHPSPDPAPNGAHTLQPHASDTSHPGRQQRMAFRARAAASFAADAAMGQFRIAAPDWAAYDLASDTGTLPEFPTPPPRPPGPVHPDRGAPPKLSRAQRPPHRPRVQPAAAPTAPPTPDRATAPAAPSKIPAGAPAANPAVRPHRPPSKSQRLRAAMAPAALAATKLRLAAEAAAQRDAAAAAAAATASADTADKRLAAGELDTSRAAVAPGHSPAEGPAAVAAAATPGSTPLPTTPAAPKRLSYGARLRQRSFGVYG